MGKSAAFPSGNKYCSLFTFFIFSLEDGEAVRVTVVDTAVRKCLSQIVDNIKFIERLLKCSDPSVIFPRMQFVK